MDKETEEEALVAKCIDEVKSQYVDWYNLGYQTCMAEKKEWVGLTDEEINSIEFPESGTATMKDFVRIIESKLKDKNT
ncbi:hypothetical protein UFOVP1025_5 [uncultured Caudovirales phage]|uniref:Uncharacterized protein n=1 Tax=uncultured Caudovirales phage TaxID=2100421 RepID=A0A6J5SX46_9CAUD|nr:hypothetical protein UFOVP852_29 [uncultured Caudovirales phage]CAB4173362.1 hypothetical protein UFOVP948_52 [uncultured Caudovirales phage]CAB4178822.1 hypothetical protein UFOVP1025_5 [uncultured Caudovirales phage]CAB4219840.1 hypothetical protein UFOVP1628_8 [uncultured Caudovirales phage]